MRLLPCILAAAAAAANVDWESMHPSSSANTLSAGAGETVTFSWTDTHDVWLMADEAAYNSCSFTGATEIHSTSVKIGDVSGLGETKYYACNVGSHCESGQKIAITWAGTATPAPSSDGCPAASDHSDHSHRRLSMTYAGACQDGGNYPLYATEAAANAVTEGDGTSHQMGDYWMPNCLEHMYHGDYSGSAPTCGASLDDSTITTAVAAWFSDATAAEATYGHISSWDTSGVTDMSYLFCAFICGPDNSNVGVASFNEDIGAWDTSGVTKMNNMFYYASSFNQDIGNWAVDSVTDTLSMFAGASAFNQDIGDWAVGSVTEMAYMFDGASAFDQDLGWCVDLSPLDMYNAFEGTQCESTSCGVKRGGCAGDLGSDGAATRSAALATAILGAAAAAL